MLRVLILKMLLESDILEIVMVESLKFKGDFPFSIKEALGVCLTTKKSE